jgi:AbrB family looped-hinge helix DNA binding protein
MILPDMAVQRLAAAGKTCKTSVVPTSRLSTKGQLVIPTRLRKLLNLQPGDEVHLSVEGRRLVLEPKTRQRAKLVRGKFGRPVLVGPSNAPRMTTAVVSAILDELP